MSDYIPPAATGSLPVVADTIGLSNGAVALIDAGFGPILIVRKRPDGSLAEIGGGVGNLSALVLGYNCWTIDPAVSQSNRPAAPGTLYLMAVAPSLPIVSGGTLAVEVPVSTGGSALTYARVGIYKFLNGVSTLIGQSADMSANFQAPITRQVPITVSAAINPGDLLYIALLVQGTTGPNLIGVYIGNTTERLPYRLAQLTGQTTLPASVTMSATTIPSTLFFLAF